MKIRSILFVALTFIITSFGCAFAQATLAGRFSLGYTDTQGNTDDKKFNLNFDVLQKKNKTLKLNYTGTYVYGKSEGVTNSDKKNLNIESEFVKNKRLSYYAKLGYLKDKFSGYNQQVIAGGGLIYQLLRGKIFNFRSRFGVEQTRDEYTDSTSNNISWLKIGYRGDRIVGKNIKLVSESNYLAPDNGVKDKYQVDFSLGGLMNVNEKIDLEMKYSTIYRNSPAVAGKKKQDSTFLTSLVYKL